MKHHVGHIYSVHTNSPQLLNVSSRLKSTEVDMLLSSQVKSSQMCQLNGQPKKVKAVKGVHLPSSVNWTQISSEQYRFSMYSKCLTVLSTSDFSATAKIHRICLQQWLEWSSLHCHCEPNMIGLLGLSLTQIIRTIHDDVDVLQWKWENLLFFCFTLGFRRLHLCIAFRLTCFFTNTPANNTY